jgi:signal transduction histidine kinase
MTKEQRLEIGLFVIRLCIGIFFLAWSIQKLVVPEATQKIFERFYLFQIPITASYVIGIVQTLVILVFVAGFFKTFSYGALLGMHAVSLISTYKQLLDPYKPTNLLFWAGVPVLAALFALFLLRDSDNFLAFQNSAKSNVKENLIFIKNSNLWQQKILDTLFSLNYRTGDLSGYLKEIACDVSKLINIDLCVITLCQQGFARVLASSIDWEGNNNSTQPLHDQLTGTVIETGQNLIVENTLTCTEYGQAPKGIHAYLGIPLRTPQGQVIGTICSFHKKTRKFSTQEIKIVELFAERAATAIDNYHLYQQQRQFNQMLESEVARRTGELKAAQVKLVEQECLAAIGEFAAGIIHEIRNPFTTIKMGLNYFYKLDLSAQAKERLVLALDEANRLERLLKEILLYAKPQTLRLSQIDINELINKVLESMRVMPEAIDRHIEFYPAKNETKIEGDEDKIKQVLINLVQNACEAVDSGDTVKLQVNSNANLKQVCIQVHNGGSPIPPEVLPKLTQPFVSTKSSGTGLGLAIVKRIVDAHDGEFLIESNIESGTTVTLKLPISTLAT